VILFLLLKKNNKLFKAKDNKKWVIIIDKENLDVESELYKKISTYTKKITKKLSKKTSKTTTKKPIKKTSKKPTKKN